MAVGASTDAPQAYKANSNSDMLRVGDLISIYSEDTFGYVYNKRYLSICIFENILFDKSKLKRCGIFSF